MEKFDIKKAQKGLFSPPKDTFVEIRVPTINFVKVNGAGDPNTATEYKTAIEWLYGVSYAMKFAAKEILRRDYVMPPLETLWWADNPEAFASRKKDRWCWTVMIMAPDFVTPALFEKGVTKIEAKRCDRPASLRFEPFDEGWSLQTMHIGSYDDEGPVLKRLHEEVMPGLGVTFDGVHHEIYLSDPRKTVPSKLKNILCQPIQKN